MDCFQAAFNFVSSITTIASTSLLLSCNKHPKREKPNAQIWLRIPEAQLSFLLAVGLASGRPMALCCCFCYFGGTWCSRHVSRCGGTAASSKLATLSRFSTLTFFFSPAQTTHTSVQQLNPAKSHCLRAQFTHTPRSNDLILITSQIS